VSRSGGAGRHDRLESLHHRLCAVTRIVVSAAKGIVLPSGGPRRDPFRPVEHREPGFDALFDDSTLVFDVFEQSASSTRLVCPPFSNLLGPMQRAEGHALPFRIQHGFLQDQILVERRAGSGAIRIDSDLGSFEIVPDPDRSAVFDGRRVLATISKDNELVWIQDWMRFHRDVHGADALLLFDNRSSHYGLDELAAAVGSVAGFDTIRVVDWPYRFGPQGDAQGRFWDSDFSQLGCLESARHGYLASASSVLQGDVDELVVPVSGASVFDAAERSRSGVVAYHGLWVPRLASDQVGVPLRHREMSHLERPRFGLKHRFVPGRRYFENKYTIVPSRTPESAQWNIHAVNGFPVSRWVSWRFHVAHYRALSTGWKYDRQETCGYEWRRHRRPRSLPRALTRVDWDS
jgi:hypothetical protein